jgi:hypothetical protein
MVILDHCGNLLMHDHIISVGTGLSTEIVDGLTGRAPDKTEKAATILCSGKIKATGWVGLKSA